MDTGTARKPAEAKDTPSTAAPPRVQVPQDFYRKLAKRPDVAKILDRLAK